jgi:hypothetical protein
VAKSVKCLVEARADNMLTLGGNSEWQGEKGLEAEKTFCLLWAMNHN